MNTSIQTIRGATRLVFDSVEAITTTTERMHETIARPPLPISAKSLIPAGVPTRRAHGLIATGVYKIIRGVNAGLREGADRSFALLPQTLGSSDTPEAETRRGRA